MLNSERYNTQLIGGNEAYSAGDEGGIGESGGGGGPARNRSN